jgi:hypothetical protein
MRDDAWHDEEEEFLGNIEKQSNMLHEYYLKEYKYYHTLSTKFNIPILVISSLNALCAISLNDFLRQRYVSILNAVLSAGTGMLGSVQLYMKINEKLTNALRSSINMKKLALKISKELTIARDQRATEGQPFLSDCFSEFNTALEQGNPLEKKMQNFLKFGKEASNPSTPSSPIDNFRSAAQSLLKMSPGWARPKSVEKIYNDDSINSSEFV